MEGKLVKERMIAAQELLQKRTVDAATISQLKTLLSGFHPRIDKVFVQVEKSYKTLSHIEKGAAIELAIESLPEMTIEEKKRKKALVLFLKWWNDLKSEVDRVQKELGDDGGQKSLGAKAGAMGAISGAANGPLGS